jgi:hypothetical protein
LLSQVPAALVCLLGQLLRALDNHAGGSVHRGLQLLLQQLRRARQLCVRVCRSSL